MQVDSRDVATVPLELAEPGERWTAPVAGLYLASPAGLILLAADEPSPHGDASR